jgi:uncharacterized protein (TIGR02996 family)
METSLGAGFMTAMREEPEDVGQRLIYADWLEEQDDPGQRAAGELLRLTHRLTQAIDLPDRPVLEARLRGLLEQGVKPVGPYCYGPGGIRFAWVPAGIFLMGSPETEPMRDEHEVPHPIRVTRGFWMGVQPVTQSQWQTVVGNKSPSHFSGANHPVENVTWEECQAFCLRLREWDGRRYRLPTEAEWEYACRAGTTTPFHFGATLSTNQANFDGHFVYDKGQPGIYRRKTIPVGSFLGNAFGLHDMHGNVWDWCRNSYADYPYQEEPDDEESNGEERVIRGGSWFRAPWLSRSAYRDHRSQTTRDDAVGLRVCFAER